MIEIVPAIIAKTYEKFEAMVRKVEPFTERVSLDISDGVFTPTSTIKGYPELLKIETPLKFDVHLMIKQPSEQMSNWYKTKADRYFVHIEENYDIKSLLEQIKYNNKKVGLVLNPETRTEEAIEFIDLIDYIQFMTVQPGFYGRVFVEEVLDKISSFHEHYPGIPIAVDGGINPETGKKAICSGASILVSGSYIFNSPSVGEAVNKLKETICI